MYFVKMKSKPIHLMLRRLLFALAFKNVIQISCPRSADNMFTFLLVKTDAASCDVTNTNWQCIIKITSVFYRYKSR